MNNRIIREPVEPWYKQFWPWFIFSLPAAVVVAGITTVVIAHRHADDMVVDEYYKDGLAINRQLEKIERAEQLGISADLTIGGEQVIMELSQDAGSGELVLKLSHPLESDRDFQLVLQPSGDGTYRAPLEHTVEPHWHWTLTRTGDMPWRVDGSLSEADFAASPAS